MKKGINFNMEVKELKQVIEYNGEFFNNKKNGKGKIEIEYYSDDELNRIFELLQSVKWTFAGKKCL